MPWCFWKYNLAAGHATCASDIVAAVILAELDQNESNKSLAPLPMRVNHRPTPASDWQISIAGRYACQIWAWGHVLSHAGKAGVDALECLTVCHDLAAMHGVQQSQRPVQDWASVLPPLAVLICLQQLTPTPSLIHCTSAM